jgi:hypothetical protein
MPTYYNTWPAKKLGRVAAPNDGLFAIAATTLALDFPAVAHVRPHEE